MHTTSETVDEEVFVELFKKEHNEQFYVLVKMHLSFLLNMPTTDESEIAHEKSKNKKWGVGSFGKKTKQKNANENNGLTYEILTQLHQLINHIKSDLKAEGIFRRTGSVERQNDLKNLLLQRQTVIFTDNLYTVHDCASVLKSILADLPESLITDTQFPIYCQIVESYKIDESSHHAKVLQCLQLLSLLLPKENRIILKDIFDLLHQVTLHENVNKMCAENLAKLFTPHLLCPRKLSPETLLRDSQSLFGMVAFMIRKFPELFRIPAQLMLDFRLHYEQANVLNESVKGTAHTAFTFVDNKLTAKENEENFTETAVAQLYAYIQSLPESSKKRKLVKQFNKENGQGTPLQVIRSSLPKNKSFGDSIKKHMFHKKLLKSMKKSGSNSQIKSASSEEILNKSPTTATHTKSSKSILFCHSYDISSSEDDEASSKRLKQSSFDTPVRLLSHNENQSNISSSDVCRPYSSIHLTTSTPACRQLFFNYRDGGSGMLTPVDRSIDRNSMSPITRSTQKMSRAMQETMMTPRSRKPVLLNSGTNINQLGKVLSSNHTATSLDQLNENVAPVELVEPKPETSSITEQCSLKFVRKTFLKSKSDGDISTTDTCHTAIKIPKLNRSDETNNTSLSKIFREYLHRRDIDTIITEHNNDNDGESLRCFYGTTINNDNDEDDSSFSSRSDDFLSCVDELKEDDDDHVDHTTSSNSICSDEVKLTDSLLFVLNGNNPECSHNNDTNEMEKSKELVLKPTQYDEDGNATVFQTSF